MIIGGSKNKRYRVWNEELQCWEDPTIREPNVQGKCICKRCGYPRIDINGVEDCDFCLQALTQCDLVDYACCGHGDDENAYISFKDGRRWILDPNYSYKPKRCYSSNSSVKKIVLLLKNGIEPGEKYGTCVLKE